MSGSGGVVRVGGVAIAEIRNWRLSRTATNPTYNSSGTARQTKRVPGNKDWTASFEFYTVDGDPNFDEGDEITVQLYLSAPAVGAKYWQGAALVNSIDTSVDVEGAAPISGAASVEGNGTIEKLTQA